MTNIFHVLNKWKREKQIVNENNIFLREQSMLMTVNINPDYYCS